MPRPLGWRQLVPGLLVTASLAFVVFAVFRWARVGALHGDTMLLYARTDNAAALVQGSEVWLGGQKVGVVRSVGLGSPAADTSLRIVVLAEVLAEYREFIRRDSYAAIRPGGSFIGAPVLMISLGGPGAARLASGDTIAAVAPNDLEAVTSRAAIASRDFPAIIANVKVLAAQLGGATSTIGAIISSDEGGKQLSAFSRRAGRLASQLSTGRGTVAQALRGDATGRARHAAAELDTLRALIASEQARLGSFRRDTTLLRNVQDLRDEVSIVRALLAEPRGTAGRVLNDEALEREMAAAQAELGVLIEDIKARPLRYVAF